MTHQMSQTVWSVQELLEFNRILVLTRFNWDIFEIRLSKSGTNL